MQLCWWYLIKGKLAMQIHSSFALPASVVIYHKFLIFHYFQRIHNKNFQSHNFSLFKIYHAATEESDKKERGRQLLWEVAWEANLWSLNERKMSQLMLQCCVLVNLTIFRYVILHESAAVSVESIGGVTRWLWIFISKIWSS